MSVIEVSRLGVKIGENYIIRDISFSLGKNKTLGIVGESGCGKSILSKTILNILPEELRAQGEILFQGRNLLEMDRKELSKVRGRDIAMVFQNPMTSLNPVVKIRKQLEETLRNHNKGLNKLEMSERIGKAMEDVGLEPSLVERYPHQLSGGQKQRIVIANAIINNPKLLIADEPTTALDVTTQKQILDLFKKLQEKYGMSIIFISHDISVIEYIADDVMVMYAGNVVERGSISKIFTDSDHPYTQALLSLRPENNRRGHKLKTIEGTVPNVKDRRHGCNFINRCSFAVEKCKKEFHMSIETESGNFAFCFNREWKKKKECEVYG